MPGRPVLAQLVARIEDRGGIEWFCNEIQSGVKVAAIARELSTSSGQIYAWLKTDEDYWPAMRDARANLAHTLVDEAIEIADKSKRADSGVTRERVGMRKWMAERYNRKDYGQPDKQATVQVNIGQLHLRSMKKYREIEEAEIEVIESGHKDVTPSDVTKSLPGEPEIAIVKDGLPSE